MVEATRPKSLFGKVPYIHEQALLTKFSKEIGAMGWVINPKKYYMLAFPPLSLKQFLDPQKRIEIYRLHHEHAKLLLNSIGV